MTVKDEQLYDACMNFCQTYFYFLLKKDEFENRKCFGCYDEYEVEQRMEFEKERLRSAFTRLYELVNEIDDEIN